MSYVELHCHSNFSFQEGTSFIHELLPRAVELGYPALAITDHDSLCGAMELPSTCELFIPDQASGMVPCNQAGGFQGYSVPEA